jgi:Crp-like helix-turn-helix protein/transcriptional regulator with AbiEi antitoxin domain of type IV toxin-antitoxin system
MLPRETQASAEVPRLLAELTGAPVRHVEAPRSPGIGRLDAIFRAGPRTFLVECKGSGNAAPVTLAVRALESARKQPRWSAAVPLVVVPHMGDVGRRLCEEAQVSWLDLSGNAHIVAPGLRVVVEGKPNRFKRAGRPRSVFAPKSARIAREMLLAPDLAFTQRELAHASGLGEGFVSRIVKRLLKQGLVANDDRRKIRVLDPNLLLDAWREAYDFDRHEVHRGHVAARSGEELLQRMGDTLAQHDVKYAATGLAAAWRLVHFAGFRLVTIYVRVMPTAEVLDAIGFREEARGANTWLVVPNDEGVFRGAEDKDGVVCVSAVQAYLDLKGHPERAKEAAEELRRRCLGWGARG